MGLRIIWESGRRADRDPNEITLTVFAYTVSNEDHEECLRMLEIPIAKNYMLTLPNEVFERYGIRHPFGMHACDYILTRYDRKTVLEALEKIPRQISEDYYLNGTPDEIIGQIERFAKVGMKHTVHVI